MNRKRTANESYLDYKLNLKKEQVELDKKLKGRLTWFSSGFQQDGLDYKKVEVQGTYKNKGSK